MNDGLETYNFDLPADLIAKEHAVPRDHSRLLVLDKSIGDLEHGSFYDIIKYLKPGDTLVLNNSKVFPARIFGKKVITHGEVEILLNHKNNDGTWQVIGKGLKVGNKIIFPGSTLKAAVTDKKDITYSVLFNMQDEKLFQELEKIGHVPLPPYIGKEDTNKDKEQYQTVYAKEKGSVAAPTAGLHFTQELLDKIRDIGVNIEYVTLHVGLGTFEPIKENDYKEHKIHQEFYSMDSEVLNRIQDAKAEGRRIIAVGTTTTRVLETVFNDPNNLTIKQFNSEISGWTNIFIYPGYEFQCVNGLITNFHLPKSSLLLLVSAFAGKESILKAYKEAIENRYRFYSYGDATLII